MGLNFPPEWRFKAPEGSTLNTSIISPDVQEEFMSLIRRTSTQGDIQEFFEKFKGYFCLANGNPHVWSSNSSWAETDLRVQMEVAAENPPLFIEAFFNACESIQNESESSFAPSATDINQILQRYNIGYLIEPPNLTLTDEIIPPVQVQEPPDTITLRGKEIFQTSLSRSEELLIEGRGREAVQESLWLLETITTAFRGLDTETGTIDGKYFNKIVKDLQNSQTGQTLHIILDWITKMHGYLSAPTGGGVRHGLDLDEGLDLQINETRLFCNLIRSYLSYLVIEHERLTNSN